MVRTLTLAAIAALSALPAAQETPAESAPLTNSGAPMRPAFQCTEQDLRLAGLACTAEDPCPVFLELASVEPVGAKVFVAGNVHTSSTTLASVLFTSDDAGKTWREPFERIRSAALDQIRFFDFSTGWVAGHVMHALPHDPFLLLTTDGGVNWRRRPVVEESRVGAIEKFEFSSRERGDLWLDRSQSGDTEAFYERYESMTGGESWMLREASSRPLLKDARLAGQPGSGWRLRPDAASNSYRVERHQADRWQSVASFAIAVGECKPPERPPVESPPAPEAPPEAAPAVKKSRQ